MINEKDYKISVGDTVVCINDSIPKYGSDKNKLTLHKRYTMIDWSDYAILILNDFNIKQIYSPMRFMKLSEFRKEKLKKIFE